MKRSLLLTILSLSALLFLSSCATTATVESRVAQYPQIYNALSQSERATVSGGRIAEGLPKDAVFLAWGAPSSRTNGGSGGKTTETWVYTTREAVVHNSASFGFGRSYGRRRYNDCRYGRSSFDFNVGPSIQYVPRTAAKVIFVNGRVSSWEERG